ncbi:hypothetical protein VNO78_14483 [Psophocarpus tetragonolobus]|uniref:Uncharacterized protein n=1 Tax=Psophocarpus tetragonolobus TaxID=3891 RepID=A0AAN9SZY3_PSOTE
MRKITRSFLFFHLEEKKFKCSFQAVLPLFLTSGPKKKTLFNLSNTCGLVSQIINRFCSVHKSLSLVLCKSEKSSNIAQRALPLYFPKATTATSNKDA